MKKSSEEINRDCLANNRTRVHLVNKNFESGDAIVKLTVKAKPALYEAMYFSALHQVHREQYVYGCIVKFPNGEIIYFKDDEFNKYFEIYEEEE